MIKVATRETVETVEELEIAFPLYRKNYDGHWDSMVKITAIYYPVSETIPEWTLDCLKVLFVRKDVGEVRAENLSCRPHAPERLKTILRDFDEPATEEEFNLYAKELTEALFDGDKRVSTH